MESFLAETIEYNFDSLVFLEKLMKKLELLPLKFKMGMFCLELEQTIGKYNRTLKSRHKTILRECLAVYNSKASISTKQLHTFDAGISQSSWTIRDFTNSYYNVQQFMLYHEGDLKSKLRELESILLIIHKVQLKEYETCYLKLLHLKEHAEAVRNKAFSFLNEIIRNLKYLAT
jgi:hypothetical protein